MSELDEQNDLAKGEEPEISDRDIREMMAVSGQVIPHKQSLSKPALRVAKKLCEKNFLVFMRVELGMDVGPHHKIWWEELKSGEDCVFMAPRDHGKSMTMARAYVIWKAKYDPWVKEILILGPDTPTTTENLDKLKELLGSHQTLKELIPPDKSTNFYSRTEIKLSNNVTVRAKGYMTPLRGRHPQLIVMDDVQNEKNSWNKEQRAALKKRFEEVILPMKDRGTLARRNRGYMPQLVAIGTAQDDNDLLHHLLTVPGFRGKKMSAIVNDETKETLWPSRYDYDSLMKIKAVGGALAFSKEYLNEPLTEETSLFPPSLFEPLKDRTLSYVDTYEGDSSVYLGVDFSVPGNADGDWTCVFAMEFNSVTNIYTPLNYWRARPESINEQISTIIDYCQRYRVTIGFLEDNLFQRIYAEQFKRYTMLPLRGHTVTHTGKTSFATGLLSFRPLFENGKFMFPYKTALDQAKTDHIIKEFNGITKVNDKIGNFTFHDDVVMGMWHSLCAAREVVFSFDFGGSY